MAAVSGVLDTNWITTVGSCAVAAQLRSSCLEQQAAASATARAAPSVAMQQFMTMQLNMQAAAYADDNNPRLCSPALSSIYHSSTPLLTHHWPC
jgi:hypothetical protein